MALHSPATRCLAHPGFADEELPPYEIPLHQSLGLEVYHHTRSNVQINRDQLHLLSEKIENLEEPTSAPLFFTPSTCVTHKEESLTVIFSDGIPLFFRSGWWKSTMGNFRLLGGRFKLLRNPLLLWSTVPFHSIRTSCITDLLRLSEMSQMSCVT